MDRPVRVPRLDWVLLLAVLALLTLGVLLVWSATAQRAETGTAAGGTEGFRVAICSWTVAWSGSG